MKSISRDLGTSLHHHVSTVIKDGIATGRYKPGEQIPTEEALCALFSVSRVTVRRAMQSLEALGLVERRRGKGTYIAPSASILTLPTPMGTYMERVAQSRALSKPSLLDFATEDASAEVCENLQLARGATVLKVVRLRVKGTLPLMHSTAYFPSEVGSAFKRADFRRYDLSEVMRRSGRTYSRIEVVTRARLADSLLASLLQVDVGSALVDMHRVGYDPKDVPIEYQVVLGPSDRYQTRMTIRE
ncbi:MAG: GntR family transcriptional regulator [Rhizobacter sp.]|nr:GntR family transcriptional regulator [Rhizobacter sp.]